MHLLNSEKTFIVSCNSLFKKEMHRLALISLTMNSDYC